ncbi:MAG: acyl-CoA dehydrogenase, partial [Hyphomicrobiales bacterium]|nr:acyl-CoA dehydrogenase [Hyphomicrobiales bacterium]
MNLPFSRPDRTTGAPLLTSAIACAEAAFARAEELDRDDAFPDVELERMCDLGLLAAPLARDLGGAGLGLEGEQAQLTLDVLSVIGWGSLPLGRLYEGHVNALRLIQLYGSPSQVDALAEDVRNGALSGVWNTQGADGLRLETDGAGFRLRGRKIFASGAGWVTRPVVTARRPDGGLVMVAPRFELSEARGRADLTTWRAQGMRASASGAFDFTGIAVSHDDIIGRPGDYELQPAFSAGAWRFCAVQLGGMERLLDCTRRHLVETGRAADPHQLTRIGQAATAVQGARLWVEAAARQAENPHDDPQ